MVRRDRFSDRVVPAMTDRPQKMLQASLLRFVRRGAWAGAAKLLEKSHPSPIARRSLT